MRRNAAKAHWLLCLVKLLDHFFNLRVNGTIGSFQRPIRQVLGGAKTARDNERVKLGHVERIERFDITTGNARRFLEHVTIGFVWGALVKL